MTIFSDLGNSISNMAWSGLGNVALTIAIILFIIIIFCLIWFFMFWKSFDINVKVYTPFGQPYLDSRAAIELEKGLTDIKINRIKYKRTHGKYVTVKGTQYFRTFMPFKLHKPIPMNMIFHDGVHLLKLSREIYVPIHSPDPIVEVNKEAVIAVNNDYEWRMWNNMMSEKINMRYQDLDIQKKVVMYIIIGIVVITLFGGFTIWIIYSTSTKGLTAADKLNSFATNLIGGGNIPK